MLRSPRPSPRAINFGGSFPWASDRKIIWLAMIVALIGGINTLILLAWVPSDVPHSWAKGWNTQSTDPIAHQSNTTVSRDIVQQLPTTMTPHRHHPGHAIPRFLIFTHYRNLLAEEALLTDQEETVLAVNIRRVIQLHDPRHTQVRFLTDEDCIESLQKTFPSLVQYFIKEKQGMFKADICRGSALYQTGGFYVDVDVGVGKDLWIDLRNDTEFVTSRVHVQSNYPKHFFQVKLGASPTSPIIYKYLELFEDHYTGKESIDKGHLGVILLKRAWDRVIL